MSDKPAPLVLPEFPEGSEPRRRRAPWWQRAFRPCLKAWDRLIGLFVPERSARRRSPWWRRFLNFLLSGWTRLIGTVVEFVVLVFGSGWGGLETYLRGRQLRRLLYSLPALATLLGATVMGVVLVHAASYDVRPAYRARAQQARADHNLELARVCYLRLVHDDRSQPADLFGLYQTLRDLKQEDQAEALLLQLSALDGSGYPPAHVARARRLLASRSVVEAMQHLDKALELRPDFVDAHNLLGQIYFGLRNWKLAEKHLARAEPSEPGLAGLLMVAAEMQGNVDGSHLWARRAADVYRQLLRADPKNVPARLGLADTFVNLQNYPAAANVLRAGMEVNPRPEFPRALGQLYALQVKALSKDKTPTDAARWSLVEKGLQEDPNNLVLLRQLLDVTHGSDAAAEQARARLQRLLAEGQSSAVLHLALGLDAYSQHKVEQARVHWERAFDLDKRMVVAANNVAWLLSHEQPSDRKRPSVVLACGVQASQLPAPPQPENLTRALELIEFILKAAPNNPSFRETRGQILATLARWKESVSDLEYALPRLPNKGPIHTTLAKDYQELGLPELAEQHRQLAQPGKP